MDPALGLLADNGGPTFTHALLEGSAALDGANPLAPGSGNPACEETDQRGVTRPEGPRCDIGAFEACEGAVGSAAGALVGSGTPAQPCVAVCGNGIVDTGEECDSGATNGAPNDPCDAECRLVPTIVPPPNEPVCGDGVQDASEECDDGNHNADDGCSPTCELETPVTCPDDDNDDCSEDCDFRKHFERLTCVLDSPVCPGEPVPIGVLKRIAKTRDIMDLLHQTVDERRGVKLLQKTVRTLKKGEKIVAGAQRRGTLSPECIAALQEMLGSARNECKTWKRSFSPAIHEIPEALESPETPENPQS